MASTATALMHRFSASEPPAILPFNKLIADCSSGVSGATPSLPQTEQTVRLVPGTGTKLCL